MSSSTPLTPSKLKEQLTFLRESISSIDASSPSTLGHSILLTIELASRDVHYSLDTSGISDAALTSLLDAVNNTAGKPPIRKDAYPHPLMAALFAAGGMAASATTLCRGDKSISNTVREACAKTMKRCKDVNDGRFYTLLKLLSSDIDADTLSSLLTDVAYANYLYGAENYADQMPMWKRCLDCALGGHSGECENHRSCGNRKTIGPLKNMMRIAASKGNMKRVEELQVWIVCGYIGAIRERIEKDNVSETKEETVFEKMSMRQLVDTFFLRKTSLAKLEGTSVEMLLEQAKESFTACPKPTDATSDESRMLYCYNEIWLHHLEEEVKIYEEVQQLIRAKKNRLPEQQGKGGKVSATKPAAKSISLEVTAADKAEIYKQTRRKVLLDAWTSWYDSEHNGFVPSGLRDAINSCSASGDLLHDCQHALKTQIQRLADVAVALQQKRNVTKKGKVSAKTLLACWSEVISFVSPLLKGYLSAVTKQYNNDDAASLDVSLRDLLECGAQSVVSATWMCEPLVSGGNGTFQQMSQLLSIAHKCLSLCKTERSKQKKLLSADISQKKSAFSDDGSDSLKMEQLLLDCSLSATTTKMELDAVLCSEENEAAAKLSVESITTIAHKATAAALASTKPGAELKSLTSYSSANAKFGTPFMQFVTAWSGQYLNPWPFCNLAQGRTIIRNARDSIAQANKIWGREPYHSAENFILDIAEADLEGGIAGGFTENARLLYESSFTSLESRDYTLGIGDCGAELLRAHCLVGLARMSLTHDTAQSEQYARNALEALAKGNREEVESATSALGCTYAWDNASFDFARSYHESTSRQLVAEALTRLCRFEEAQSFLHDAVKAAPENFDAAFALASFQLRKILINRNEGDAETVKKDAKTQLIKSAKMDKGSSSFALLGLFYEMENDSARALGCHKKALSIDPSNPISGRGLQRLVSAEEMKPYCEAAIQTPSSVNGWAWRAVGQVQYAKYGDYESAVICFQQALRCRDIHDHGREVLGLFYTDPMKLSKQNEEERYCEAGETWCDLGSCYRDMGKWSGSHRAFDAAHSVSRGNLSPDSLVAWAQVELELGLYDESIEHCDAALSSCMQPHVQRLASFAKGQAILALSRQNLHEGKYGACLAHIKMGMRLDAHSYSELKLLGDLCSVSEALPSYVFIEDGETAGSEEYEYNISVEVKRKLQVLSTGSDSYKKGLELTKEIVADDEDKNNLVAAAATDLGCNLLAQARVLSLALGDGSGGDTRTGITDLTVQHSQLQKIIQEAIDAFICAVDSSPHEAPAWCGIGCALAAIDPMKAQHSFARALELDKGAAEAWANMGVLFAHYDIRDKGSEILDALTQAEDTPLMWICRGLLFESASGAWQEQVSVRETNLSKAADAYRAALQISQHPLALFGLSLTCRRNNLDALPANDIVYSTLASEASTDEGRLNMSIHQSIAGNCNHLASYVNGFMQLENSLNRARSCNPGEGTDAFKLINSLVDGLQERKNMMGTSRDPIESTSMQLQCGIICSLKLPLRATQSLGNVPSEIMDEAITKTAAATTSQAALNHKTAQQLPVLEDTRNAAHLNPDSGEKWLEFAKALSKDINQSTTALASAKAAASRAYEILHDSAVYASMISSAARSFVVEDGRISSSSSSMDRSENKVVSQVASADIVSEALSLVAWLEDLEKFNSSRDKEDNDLDLALTQMQEAYLLDPSNKMAAFTLGLA